MKKFLISLVCLFLVFEVVYNSETAKNALTNAAASCFDIPLKPGVFDFASASPELYIAHAGGVIDGQCHTNSREAVEESLRRGYRYIELDLQVTRDNHLVAVHDWDRLRDMAGAPELPVPPTLAEVRGLTLKGGLHILDGKDIAELMLRHPRCCCSGQDAPKSWTWKDRLFSGGMPAAISQSSIRMPKGTCHRMCGDARKGVRGETRPIPEMPLHLSPQNEDRSRRPQPQVALSASPYNRPKT